MEIKERNLIVINNINISQLKLYFTKLINLFSRRTGKKKVQRIKELDKVRKSKVDQEMSVEKGRDDRILQANHRSWIDKVLR